MADTLYTFEYDGERKDWECATPETAKRSADDWFAARFEDEAMRNGETREDEGYIVAFHYDDESGEIIEDSREKYDLLFEYYHGDLAEHGTWG